MVPSETLLSLQRDKANMRSPILLPIPMLLALALIACDSTTPPTVPLPATDTPSSGQSDAPTSTPAASPVPTAISDPTATSEPTVSNSEHCRPRPRRLPPPRHRHRQLRPRQLAPSPTLYPKILTFTPTPSPAATIEPSRPELLWQYKAPAEVWGAAVTDGVVLTSSDDNTVRAVTASTGELLWERERFGLAVAVSDGIVYAGPSDDGQMYALDATTGEALWEREGFGLSGGLGRRSLVGTGRSLHVRDASGGIAWNTFPGFPWPGRGWPAVSDGVVYVSSWDPAFSDDGRLHALAASTGELLWEYEVEGQPSWPVALDGVVYVSSSGDRLYALDASTGELIWEYEGLVSGPPAVSGGVVYVGSWDPISNDGRLYALAASTGKPLWEYEVEGPVSSPHVTDGVVYLIFPGHHALPYASTRRLLQWAYHSTRSWFGFGLAVSDGVLYVGSVLLYALALP